MNRYTDISLIDKDGSEIVMYTTAVRYNINDLVVVDNKLYTVINVIRTITTPKNTMETGRDHISVFLVEKNEL